MVTRGEIGLSGLRLKPFPLCERHVHCGKPSRSRDIQDEYSSAAWIGRGYANKPAHARKHHMSFGQTVQVNARTAIDPPTHHRTSECAVWGRRGTRR